jgi:hypothetical protein
MRHLEWLLGAVVVLIGLGVSWEALSLGYTSFGIPGAGFFPFWAGVLLVVSGLGLVVQGILAPRAGDERIAGGQLITMAGAAAYLVLIATVGAIAAGILFIGAMIWGRGGHGWLVTMATALAAMGLIYAVFRVWLNIPLPRGALLF